VKMDSTNGLSEERKLKRKCNGSWMKHNRHKNVSQETQCKLEPFQKWDCQKNQNDSIQIGKEY
jgi:hypothetical protein